MPHESPNAQLPDTAKENLQEEDNIAQVLSLAEEQVLKVRRRAEASVPPKQANQKAARAARDRGWAYLQSRQISEAIGALQEAHRADPADVEIVRILSNAYLQNNDLNSAEGYMLTALTLEPETEVTWHRLGGIYAKKGEIPASAASYTNSYRVSKAKGHTHRQFLRLIEEEIDVNDKRAMRLATQVIQRKLLSAQTIALDEVDKFFEEQTKAHGAVAPLNNERESRKLSRTPEAYEGKVIALGGRLDRSATGFEFASRGSRVFFVQPAIGGLTGFQFYARGVDKESKTLGFDRFFLIGVWERGKKAGEAGSALSGEKSWGINTYLICGVVRYEKAKEADVLCETLKKP